MKESEDSAPRRDPDFIPDGWGGRAFPATAKQWAVFRRMQRTQLENEDLARRVAAGEVSISNTFYTF